MVAIVPLATKVYAKADEKSEAEPAVEEVSENVEPRGYPIYVTVSGVQYVAYYDNKHGDTHIKFERQAFTQSGNVEFIKFYKGTPNVQYNPLYL